MVVSDQPIEVARAEISPHLFSQKGELTSSGRDGQMAAAGVAAGT